MKRTACRGKNKWLLVTALMVLCVFALWVSGFGSSLRTWERLEMNGLDFGDAPNKTFTLEEGVQYGELNKGPKFSLPAGRYQLKWAMQMDGENHIRIRSGNGARIEPAEMTLVPDQWTTYAEFTLLDDAENLEIVICFEEGTFLAIHDFELRTFCTDRAWLLTLVAACVCVWCMLEYKGMLTAQRRRMLLLIAVAVIVASVPLFRENLTPGHDSEFHRSRLRNAVSALSEGQFPVRVGGYMYHGYGGASSVFYPDMWLYGPALMMMGGATIQLALSVLLFAVNAVSAATMYALVSRVFASGTAGAAAAILYLLAPYRLTDLYTRMALGEAAAMAVIPLFLLGLWEVLCGKKERWPLLAAGATAVFLSHMLSTVLCAGIAVLAGVCLMKKLICEKRVGSLLKAIAATALLNLFYLVPLLDYMTSGISMGALLSDCAAAALDPVQLLISDASFPLNIGHALLLCAAAAGYAMIGEKTEKSGLAWLLLAAGAAFALMTTKLFPWGALAGVLGESVNYLQFPWRLMTFVDIFLAGACGYGLSHLQKKRQWKDIVLAVLVLCVLTAWPQMEQYTRETKNQYHYWKSNSSMVVAYKEYTLPGSNLRKTTDYSVETEGTVQVESYEKRGTHASAQIKAETDAKVSFPLFGFDGYKAALDGEEVAWTLGKNNRLTVDLPAGAQGEVRVWFAGKTVWRIADCVSLITAAALAALCLRRRRTARRG